MALTEASKSVLRKIARNAVAFAARNGSRPTLADLDAPADGEINRPGASFITLRRHSALRGCMGSLEAEDSLALNVARNAYRSALHDPRFPALSIEELAELEIHIAVLSPLERIEFQNEAGLLRQLVPGRDGLLIRAGQRQATFLPAVWDQLTEPDSFFLELKRKARLPADRPTPGLEAFRYTTESFSE